MNKKTLIITIVAVVIVVLVVILGVHLKKASAPEVSNNATSTASSTLGSSVSSTATSSSSQASSTVGVTVTKSYSNSSFSFNYPNSWSINTYSPFSMTNFGGKYLSGGIIPSGGAEIDVVTTTLYSSLQSIMTTETMNGTNATTTNLSVGGVVCPAVAFQNINYAPGVVAKNVNVYCQRGTELWKMYLSYRLNDPASAAHIADFNSVLGSIKFLP